MRMIRFLKRYRLSLIGAFVALLLSLAYIMEPGIDVTPPSLEKKPDFIFDDVHLIQYIDGHAVWELDAKHANIYNTDDYAQLYVVSGNIYEEDERRVSMNAPEARMDMSLPGMRLQSPLVSYYLDKQTVHARSDKLYWDGNLNHFYASGNVVVHYPSAIIYGEKFFVDVPKQQLLVEKQSRAEVIF